MSELLAVLEEGRRREREQAMFYRMLAGDAELAGAAPDAERLNELLADEQHHVSRLTARLLELGAKPTDERVRPEVPDLGAWEGEARRRETDEVAWYEGALERVQEPETAQLLREILESERHHRERLAGKWMSAAPTEDEAER